MLRCALGIIVNISYSNLLLYIILDIFYSVWGIVYLHTGHSTTFSQINEQLHTFFLHITHRSRS